MLLGQRFSPHTSIAEASQLVRSGVTHTSLHERGLLPPLRALMARATDPDPRKRPAHAGELAAELRGLAAFLRIPDVPAYVARAVADAFPPDKESVARLTDPSDSNLADMVPDLVIGDTQDLAWAAELVELPAHEDREIEPATSAHRPPMQSGVAHRNLDSAPTLQTAANWFEDPLPILGGPVLDRPCARRKA
jgi:hypothetical protein